MTAQEDVDVYLSKAQESLASAQSEFANGRYNSCANRCYFACFQAAVAALVRGGVVSAGPRAQLGHAYVQAQFAGGLVNRRKQYPGQLRDVLPQLGSLRQTADYESVSVTMTRASRALSRANEFVTTVLSKGGGNL